MRAHFIQYAPQCKGQSPNVPKNEPSSSAWLTDRNAPRTDDERADRVARPRGQFAGKAPAFEVRIAHLQQGGLS